MPDVIQPQPVQTVFSIYPYPRPAFFSDYRTKQTTAANDSGSTQNGYKSPVRGSVKSNAAGEVSMHEQACTQCPGNGPNTASYRTPAIIMRCSDAFDICRTNGNGRPEDPGQKAPSSERNSAVRNMNYFSFQFQGQMIVTQRVNLHDTE